MKPPERKQADDRSPRQSQASHPDRTPFSNLIIGVSLLIRYFFYIYFISTDQRHSEAAIGRREPIDEAWPYHQKQDAQAEQRHKIGEHKPFFIARPGEQVAKKRLRRQGETGSEGGHLAHLRQGKPCRLGEKRIVKCRDDSRYAKIQKGGHIIVKQRAFFI